MNKLLSPKQVREYYNISESTMRRLMDGRKITFHKVGRSIRFRPEDVEKYLNDNKIIPIK